MLCTHQQGQSCKVPQARGLHTTTSERFNMSARNFQKKIQKHSGSSECCDAWNPMLLRLATKHKNSTKYRYLTVCGSCRAARQIVNEIHQYGIEKHPCFLRHTCHSTSPFTRCQPAQLFGDPEFSLVLSDTDQEATPIVGFPACPKFLEHPATIVDVASGVC
jgi:hypothetical protein